MRPIFAGAFYGCKGVDLLVDEIMVSWFVWSVDE